jgi:Zn-dependent peptidase ImmA (M78 family)
MNIPKSFQLFGSTYTVEIEDNLRENTGNEADHSYRLKRIRLQTVSEANTQDAQEHAFLHELVHAILNQMNEFDLNGNEKFVDVFSGMLHQAIKTMEE